MRIFPAIDLLDGKVVRLTEGNYDAKRVYSDDPLETALAFRDAGAKSLHVVDLDGAREGTPRNFDVLRVLARESGLSIQCGGGIRDPERVREVLGLGVGRAILGTAALRSPAFLDRMLEEYGAQIAVGVDARDGMVAVEGWLETTGTDAMAFCRELRDRGVRTVIYTDIARDGQMAGANMDAYRALRALEGLRIIASGGISSLGEVQALRDLGLQGAILGKALYEKKIDLAEAIRLASRKGGV